MFEAMREDKDRKHENVILLGSQRFLRFGMIFAEGAVASYQQFPVIANPGLHARSRSAHAIKVDLTLAM